MIKNLLAINFSWYGLIIASGMLICIILAYFLLKKRGYNPDIVYTVAIISIPCAVLGARIYYIVFDILGGSRSFADWFKNSAGKFTLMRFFGFVEKSTGWEFEGLKGLAVYGGLIAASLGGLIARAINKKDKNPRNQMTYIQMLDAFFVLIILGQSIGRWGNYANQEAYGNLVTNPNLQWFPYAVNIDGQWHQATFFYESFLNFIGFFIMLYLWIGKRRSFDGFVFAFYCIWYGTVRFFIEGLRSDSLYIGSFRASQLVSLMLILSGAGIIAYHVTKAKRYNKKLFIFTPITLLNTDYMDYEKSIMFIYSVYNKDGSIKNETDFENNILSMEENTQIQEASQVQKFDDKDINE